MTERLNFDSLIFSKVVFFLNCREVYIKTGLVFLLFSMFASGFVCAS